MKEFRPYILYIIMCWGMIWKPACMARADAKDFVVVIDAGHGGHDPGAIGRISKEKDINLKVALKLGKMIEQQHSDVKVLYTRKKDTFIPLARRAEIANNAKADLFISIHTNSLPNNSRFTGVSTWTLGLAKSDANLAVAKRENAVILYEDDYKTRYAGFDPNSAESYIIFEFMQDQHMSQSVHLASLIQQEMRNACKRTDRGVHQAGFLVLKASAMPSILVELGFISSPEEERYLNTEAGSTNLAKGIFRAFTKYREEQRIRQNGTADSKATDKEASRKKDAGSGSQLTFKVQFLTSSEKLKPHDKRLKGLKDIEYYRENGLYKYTCGASANYNETVQTKRLVSRLFKDAFIIAFKNGKKTDVNAAIDEFKQKNNQ